MINISEVLSGPVSAEAIRILLDIRKTGCEEIPKPGYLAIFDHTIRPAEFYGLQDNEPGLELMALLGRWQVVNMFGKDMLIKCRFEDDSEDVEDFINIFHIHPNVLIEKFDDEKQRPSNSRECACSNREFGFTSVHDTAENSLAGIMVLAGARPYEPSEVIEHESVN